MKGIWFFLVAFITTLIGTFYIIPLLRKLNFKQTIREEGPKSHYLKKGTPTMGGLIFIGISLLGSIIYSFVVWDFRVLFVALFVSLYSLVGFLDDYIKSIKKSKDGLKPTQKMIFLLIISVVFSSVGYFIKIFSGRLVIPFLGYGYVVNIGVGMIFLSILVLLAVTNAVNFSDGIDGLAGTLAIIVILTYIIITSLRGQWDYLNVYSYLMIGGIAGFLFFNYHPARVFMGDSGSLALGAYIAILAIITESTLILPVIGLVYVIEVLSVIIQVLYFKKTGKRIFKMSPIHHHFELSGYSENKIVLLFSLFTVITCVLGLFMLGIRAF